MRAKKTIIHVYYTIGGKIRVLAHTNGSLPRRGRTAHWDGPSAVKTDQPANRHGATTWIETTAPVTVKR